MTAVQHLIVAPIVLPLAAGAVLMLTGQRWPRISAVLSLAATLGLVILAAYLLRLADAGAVHAYLLGNWLAPFGIALALDRLAALMLLLTALVALISLLYALGGDARRGAHFHALFQFQLMGLAGAFLTADLFNLFVFFEVLLAASYGLSLHGQGARQRASLRSTIHYMLFNLVGSALFLIAVSLLYGITGTLNMAHLAVRLLDVPPENAALAQAAALLLLTVFAVKAALLPLYFWLPEAYASASAPVAALFAIMTKVGVYAIARTTTLLFGGEEGPAAQVFTPALPALALATLVLAAIGALAATRLRGLVAYLVIASAGTLMLAIGLGTPGTLAAGVFYLVNSTLVAAALFLIADRIAAARLHGDAMREACALTPASWAPLGVAFFIAAVAVCGVPPLAGFFGKALLLQAAGQTDWAMGVVATVLGASLALLVALARAGSTLFWKPGAPSGQVPSTTRPAHVGAIVAALGLVIATTLAAGPLHVYAQATAAQLFERRGYVNAVLGAPAAPPAWDIRREMRERGELK
jgi:multicomponent K+:H+ antiporter subunit D